jgi:hypothetical protein
MFPEKMSEHVNMAEAAQDWLRSHGSRIVDMRVFMRRPLLEIACPPAALVAQASRISESFQGGTRSVWVASVNGCRVIWR